LVCTLACRRHRIKERQSAGHALLAQPVHDRRAPDLGAPVAPVGLLFPASLVRHGDWIYVTNLSLDLRLFRHPTVDSEWAAAVNVHTIARIRARIP
jgi:hypothetical protein